ncbi:glycosyltransferase family 9 protein [Burkholderia vietnamiensis]|uniref:glycosyltransferase family 9 protein n=1 Tax=Burkholderia vietnamiensis TaxID=60552 RepID=UPI00075BA6DD|nr:glycosyltransferase family 9 protein [Burkholderia vietnamiensis]KVF80616.1 ADP-heptose--LPS heptosyltransferase [Burkholderia vietnamiensis]KVF85800.1 ADP-heptose--LPS heptosyltransferase [Burkholderia vietnamiensis]KVF94420.1 ADP-heptose--LPS heptosyltransferase [Burkholderia vietnamiensis]KVF98375.1 ADP-heptose--LPS heptosyltransferase [Burkholderia vietnamiensis]
MTHDSASSSSPTRIAVFRALQLGDMLCAVPALRALRRGEPEARITLIGLPWAREFASRFPDYIDNFIAFPGAPGLAEQPAADAAAREAFVAECRARDFDLAIQLHGSGAHTNAIVASLGAARTAGFVPADGGTTALDCSIVWRDDEPEVTRYLSLMRKLGYRDWGDYLEFPLGGLDYALWHVLRDEHALEPGRYVVVHLGARMASRRWPVERFARTARQLADDGWQIVLTGTRAELALANAFAEQLARPCVNLCGRTPLGAMAALIARARLLLCNDTGVSHVAAALGTPSVVVACGSDTARWAPLDAERHRVLASYPACRPCMFDTCPYGHECAIAIGVDDVIHQAGTLLAQERRHVT